MKPTTFGDLAIGDTFDFISGTYLDSFFQRCEKIARGKYRDEDGVETRIGSSKALVYHVQRKGETTHEYEAEVKHDRGQVTITTWATHEASAIDLIMKSELCPRSSILSIRRVTKKGEA